MSVMTLERIDSELREWDRKLRVASDNMLELSDSVGYQRLLGEGHWPKAQLAGATAARAQPAIDGLHTLWTYYSLLRDTIARAKKLRESIIPLLPAGNAIGEIDGILHGPSIALLAVATPLEQRGLLAAAETTRSIAPEPLLAMMHDLFQKGRDVVTAIAAAWDRLPQQFTDFEALLSKLVAEQGVLPHEIEAARQDLARLQRQFDADPLAAAEGCAALAAQIESIRRRSEQLAVDRQRVCDDLLAARRLLAEVTDSHRQAMQTFGQCRLKVSSEGSAASPCPADDDLVAALEKWLVRLEAEVAAGRWQPVRIGLVHWNVAARQYQAADRQSQEASESLLNQRRDLRGLLGALKAKAIANGRAEDPALAEIEHEAKELLAHRPTPLETLQRMVADYQQRLL